MEYTNDVILNVKYTKETVETCNMRKAKTI